MIRAVLIIFLLAFVLVIGYLSKNAYLIKNGRKSILLNMSLLVLTILITIVVLELFFYSCVIQTDNLNITLSSKRWLEKYWHPIDSYGYRDIEHVKLPERKKIFVVGDSFAAGYGIKDIRYRFSNILGEMISKDWVVINIAKNGWTTVEEIAAITTYPYKPDVIILSYFINDIEGAAIEAGFNRPLLMSPPRRIIKPLIDNSYLFNYMYWRLYKKYFLKSNKIFFEDYLSKAFSDKIIWKIHEKQLIKLISFIKINNIHFIVIVFPYLNNIEKSKIMTSKVVGFFDDHNIKVIDLAILLSGRKYKELVVSSIDAHPNLKLHREIGELLYKYISNYCNTI
jgi:hypothetical protein